MPLYKRMRKYMQIKQLDAHEIVSQTSIPAKDFENFLQGNSHINSQQLEQLNEKWPELISYGFDIDPDLCTDGKELP